MHLSNIRRLENLVRALRKEAQEYEHENETLSERVDTAASRITRLKEENTILREQLSRCRSQLIVSNVVAWARLEKLRYAASRESDARRSLQRTRRTRQTEWAGLVEDCEYVRAAVKKTLTTVSANRRLVAVPDYPLTVSEAVVVDPLRLLMIDVLYMASVVRAYQHEITESEESLLRSIALIEEVISEDVDQVISEVYDATPELQPVLRVAGHLRYVV